jgi:hypothetical protein
MKIFLLERLLKLLGMPGGVVEAQVVEAQVVEAQVEVVEEVVVALAEVAVMMIWPAGAERENWVICSRS